MSRVTFPVHGFLCISIQKVNLLKITERLNIILKYVDSQHFIKLFLVPLPYAECHIRKSDFSNKTIQQRKPMFD